MVVETKTIHPNDIDFSVRGSIVQEKEELSDHIHHKKKKSLVPNSISDMIQSVLKASVISDKHKSAIDPAPHRVEKDVQVRDISDDDDEEMNTSRNLIDKNEREKNVKDIYMLDSVDNKSMDVKLKSVTIVASHKKNKHEIYM